MSKVNVNKRAKLSKETSKMNKSADEPKSGKINRKRTRSNVENQTRSSPVDDSKLPKNSKGNNDGKAESVKRRIDFNDSSQESRQVNNNASRLNPIVDQKGIKEIRVKRPARKVNEDRPGTSTVEGDNSLSRVQWTKEFMNKIRLSNEKYRQRYLNKINQTCDDIFQADDGVTLGVEGLDPEEELLDYEDDLSMEEEEINKGDLGKSSPVNEGEE